MSFVLRYFGFDNSMVLQHQKLKIQKTRGTENKMYQTDATRPTTCSTPPLIS